jgi:hypothetical protein
MLIFVSAIYRLQFITLFRLPPVGIRIIFKAESGGCGRGERERGHCSFIGRMDIYIKVGGGEVVRRSFGGWLYNRGRRHSELPEYTQTGECAAALPVTTVDTAIIIFLNCSLYLSGGVVKNKYSLQL